MRGTFAAIALAGLMALPIAAHCGAVGGGRSNDDTLKVGEIAKFPPLAFKANEPAEITVQQKGDTLVMLQVSILDEGGTLVATTRGNGLTLVIGWMPPKEQKYTLTIANLGTLDEPIEIDTN